MEPVTTAAASIERSTYFVTGGTLSMSALCYVTRRADTELMEALAAGEFCYVLTARQMGKSSLMVRAAAALKTLYREERGAVAAVDLTALGQNTTPDQWYLSILIQIGRRLGLEWEMEEYWQTRSQVSPLQRWMGALQDVLLQRIPGRVAVFVDEIDMVRSLPFATDEFFAAIRACYNQRASVPEFERLTFCLLGVAAPSDLIQDVKLTPFNIGRRIELADFTQEEAAPLADGFDFASEDPEVREYLLTRILHWTGGHPYLTQRLCQAVVEAWSKVREGTANPIRLVDQLCEELFLTSGALEQDDNLTFVRDRLLRGASDTAALLDLYGKSLSGRRVRDDEADPLVSALKLSGVVAPQTSGLTVRNRIYETVFDRHWVRENMPDAEVRRQRAAYRHGVVRALSISGVVVAMIAVLLGVAVQERRRAEAAQKREAVERRAAEDGRDTLANHAYAGDVERIERWVAAGDIGQAVDMLHRYESDPRREFAWSYWQHELAQDQPVMRGHSGIVFSIALSPDGHTLISGSQDHTLGVWDTESNRRVGKLCGHTHNVLAVAYSPNANVFASGSEDETVRIWSANTLSTVAVLGNLGGGVVALAFSPDGQFLAGMAGENVRIWSLAQPSHPTLVAKRSYRAGRFNVGSLAYSPSGQILAVGLDRSIELLDGQVHGKQSVRPSNLTVIKRLRCPDRRDTYSIAFDREGERLAAGRGTGEIILWNRWNGRKLCSLRAHKAPVNGLSFSTDGTLLASAGWDEVARVWRVGRRRSSAITLSLVREIRGHPDKVTAVQYSPQSGQIYTSGGEEIRRWQASRTGSETNRVLSELPARALNPFVLPNGGAVMYFLDGAVRRRDLKTNRDVLIPGILPPSAGAKRHDDTVGHLCCDFQGRYFAATTQDGRLFAIDNQTGRRSLLGTGSKYVAVAETLDGKAIAAATSGSDGEAEVHVWNSTQHNSRTVLQPGKSDISCVSFSPDAQVVAIGHWSGFVTLWNIRTGAISKFRASNSTVCCIGFSPNGREIATGTRTGSIRIWDLNTLDSRQDTTRREVPPLDVLTIAAYRCEVTFLRFVHDGRALVSVGSDGTVRMWGFTQLYPQ